MPESAVVYPEVCDPVEEIQAPARVWCVGADTVRLERAEPHESLAAGTTVTDPLGVWEALAAFAVCRFHQNMLSFGCVVVFLGPSRGFRYRWLLAVILWPVRRLDGHPTPAVVCAFGVSFTDALLVFGPVPFEDS